MFVSKVLAHGHLCYFKNHQNFIEMSSDMIYIVALGGGFNTANNYRQKLCCCFSTRICI